MSMGDRFLLHPVQELGPELALTELQTYRPLRFGPTGSATTILGAWFLS